MLPSKHKDAMLPFLLCLMFFHQSLNQSSIWLKSFRSLAISSSIHFYGSLNSLLLAITPVLLHSNLVPALKGFFSSSKFFYLILQITSLIPETVLLTFKVSLYRSESIASLLFSCIILLILCAPQSQIYTLLYSIGASVSYIPFDLPLL